MMTPYERVKARMDFLKMQSENEASPVQKFVNFHILTSHTASCLNRDDAGLPKDFFYGGEKRLRVSSQCNFQGIRNSDEYIERFGIPSLRTTNNEFMVNYLKGLDEYRDVDERVIKFIVNCGMKGQTTVWVSEEVAAMVSTVLDILAKNGKTPEVLEKMTEGINSEFDKGDSSSEKTDKKESKKGSKKESKKKEENEDDNLKKELVEAISKRLVEINKGGYSLFDVALKGRMCACGALSSIESAMSLAHSFTTHKVLSEQDWFTTMDMLRNQGAGFIEAQEFGAGVFYTYACINLDTLAKNLSSITTRKEAAGPVGDLVPIMSRFYPTGKQNAFASFPYSEYFMVTNSNDVPLSLASAFEKPVAKDYGGGFMNPSIEALETHWLKMKEAHGLGGRTAVFTTRNSSLAESGVQVFGKISELADWVKGV